MELWIRSQDKTQLANITGLILVDSQIRAFTTTKDYYELGTYETKERALEVLDEIQRLITYLQYINYAVDSSSFYSYRQNVYEMPKE